jgi:hypothetical protein
MQADSGVFALSITIALNADSVWLVAAVRVGRTVSLVRARLEAAMHAGIADELARTVTRDQASHAAP